MSSAPKSRKGISPATAAQRAKVRACLCVVCGADPLGGEGAKIDPAHIWDRSQGGCDSVECVVPLCRRCHDLYDGHTLDILPALLRAGYYEEIAHPIREHQVSPVRLLERLTGARWVGEERD